MSKLSKQRAKEAFLKTVEGVSKEVAFEEIKNNTEGVDLYTYFVTKDAFKSGVVDDKDIGEFALNVYSDWYFLHKNSRNKAIQAVKLLSDVEFSPATLTTDKCLDLIRSDKYRDELPISMQFINKLEDKYFLCVKTDVLYNKTFKDFTYEVRLYINLPYDSLLPFAKEFLDKAYVEEFPALLKILNNDHRCDTIIIYTDYEYVQKVVDVIGDIRAESKSIFSKIGAVSPLLGNIDDFIGFGEQLTGNATYFSSRCQALSSINRCAGLETLREGIVAREKEMIVVKDGRKFTPTQYLGYLIERNAVKLVESKIHDIESRGVESSNELDRLYAMREDVRSGLDIDDEVNALKRSITRKSPYTLSIKGVGEDDYNYINKLYNLFTTEDERLLSYTGDRGKKNKIKSKLFGVTDELSGVKTKDFLDMYFKEELGIALKEFIDREIEGTKRGRQNGLLTNIRKKSIARLKAILKAILNDSDDGREYIDDCIYDYVRILSTGSAENIAIYIDGREISVDKDVNTDILSLLPELEKEVQNLSINMDFVDRTLGEFGINKDNMCINSKTKNIFKEKREKKESDNYYYYNPDGYLSKE